MRTVLAIAGTSLRRFLRDKSNYFFVFVFPLVLVVLIGLQFGGSSSALVITVGDGELAQALRSHLQDAGVDVLRAANPRAGSETLARGRADAMVIIDAADESAFAGTGTIDLEVVVGSTNGGLLATPIVNAAIADIDQERQAIAALVAAGVPAADARTSLAAASGMGPQLIESVAGNDSISAEFAGLGQFDLGAAQELSLFVFLSSLTAATTLIQSRQLGVTRRALAAPVRPAQLVVGEATGRFAIAVVQGLYIVVGTAVLFGVKWGDITATVAVLAAFCGVSAAAALVLGAVIDNEASASGIGVGVGLVVAAIGGSMLPIEFMPDSMLIFSRLTPHYWAYEAYAEITRHDGGIVDVWRQLAVLIVMTGVMLPIGSLLLRRSLERAL